MVSAWLALAGLSAVVSAIPSSTDTVWSTPSKPRPFVLAPLITPNVAQERIIADTYVVLLKNSISGSQVARHINEVASKKFGDPLLVDDGGLRHVYDAPGFKGYAGKFTAATIELLRSQPEIELIEKSQIFRTADTEHDAPWGLARISHRKKLALDTLHTYLYDKNGGEGVDAYVIDTGIYIGHSEFEGRARWGKTIPRNDTDTDDNGHGTHCAGIIGSRKYGIAKKANLIAVKAFRSDGVASMEDIVGGVTWAANDALARKANAEAQFKRTGKRVYKGAVANMSFGGGKSEVLDRAVNAAVASGLHAATAAGNDHQDACESSPARATEVVTAGASSVADEMAYFSNHGPCVDIFAPGVSITSAWIGGRIVSGTFSGTSAASAHTAGLLVYLLSIYPSVTSNLSETKVDIDEVVLGLKSQTYNKLRQLAKSILPGWMAISLYAEEQLKIPVPSPLPTPAMLKKALLALSTKDALSMLPAKTVNLLIFNNATDLGSCNSF